MSSLLAVCVFNSAAITFAKSTSLPISSAKKFVRSIENQKLDNIYHHIGIYIYKVTTLKKFVGLKQSPNEISLKLEQLRALHNNIKIDVVFANSIPVGVDTNEDFLEIKKLMEYKS